MSRPSASALSIWDRIGAGCGAAYVLLVIVGNQIAGGSGTDPHPSGAKDLADFSATPGASMTIGFSLELISFLILVFFLAWFVSALRARGGAATWLAGAAALAGGVTLAVKMGSMAPMAVGFLDHSELAATTARLLVDINMAAFVITFVTFGTFLVASGLAILASGFLGRFAGWAAVVIGVLAVLLSLVTRMDPANTNPMPFLAGLLWVLVNSIVLAWKGPREVTTEVDAAVPVLA